MAYNHTRIADHTAFEAATLNAPFTAIRAAVNSVPADDIPDGAFRAEHLPSLVVASAFQMITSDTVHRYICVGGIGGAGINYAPYPGFGAVALDAASPTLTWHTVNSGGTNLVATFTTAVDLTDPTIGGILVLANVAVKTIGQTWNTAGGNYSIDVYGLWTIFTESTGGTKNNISRCERYRCANIDGAVAPPNDDWITTRDDVSIRTLIRPSDMIVPATNVKKVIVACSVAHCRTHANCGPGEQNDYAYVECMQGSVTALALQSTCVVT